MVDTGWRLSHRPDDPFWMIVCAAMNMLLILSFRGSLAKWRREGILTRELELYLAHLRAGTLTNLHILTYGTGDDAELDGLSLPPDLRARITLERPRWPRLGLIGALAHSLDVVAMKRLRREGVDLAKTNQISGGWAALAAAMVGIPVLARCGYILSRRFALNGHLVKAWVARGLERALFSRAKLVSVTTAGARDELAAAMPGLRDRIMVAPTYVDTDLFIADAGSKSIDDRLVYVGRLEPQKNVLAIVEACAKAGIGLLTIGEGSLGGQVKALATRLGVDLDMRARMPNNDIAAIFASHRYYILASLHEGLPKSLIEAMSSEMVCIGSEVPGINDLLTDGQTGFLSIGTDAESIAAAIGRARTAGMAATSAAKAARLRALRDHSIGTYVERESVWLRQVAARG
jgi:glycosyltransferase involved in cell wall biosynthesis